MQTIVEYLERAQVFEKMAAQAEDAEFKKRLLAQADGYRRLAEKRAAEIGAALPPIEPPHSS